MRMSLRALLLLVGISIVTVPVHAQQLSKMTVDLALVLAVDVSGSVNEARWNLQKRGYAEAIRSRDVVRLIMSGHHRKIAVMFVQWAGSLEQYIVGDSWSVISDQESAQVFATMISDQPRKFSSDTAIADAIAFCTHQLETMPFAAQRRVIDISGDGKINASSDSSWTYETFLEMKRTYTISRGVTINGLPIRAYPGSDDDPTIRHYYDTYVIGGAGAFSVYVHDPNDFQAFTHAVRRKLLLEIAVKN